MKRLLDFSIAINIIGLMALSALESARPGMVSAAVNVGVVWLGAVVLLSLGLLEKKE